MILIIQNNYPGIAKAIIALIFCCTASISTAQVSTEIEKRKPVLMDYTGMRCSPCGDLSLWLEDYITNKPEVIILGTHGSGSFATPASPFDIDMRCVDADLLTQEITFEDDNIFKEVNSFPTLILDGKETSKTNLPSDIETLENENSFVNIDLQSTLNEATREIAISIEMYFTVDAPSEAFVNVGLLQDDLFGYQLGQPGSISGNFTFNHVLKDMISTTFGNSLGTPVEGQTILETFTYVIPESIEFSSTTVGQDPELIIDDLSIFAYVSINEETEVNGNSKTHHVIETGIYQKLESIVSVEEIEHDLSIIVWPNPNLSGQAINISTEVNLNDVSIAISDPFGREILFQTGIDIYANTNYQLNTSNLLNPGLYIIVIESKDNKIFKKMIIE